MKPLVSILMTAYNREQYIAEAIESLLVSTYTNFELIIVDDGSKDDTLTIARSLQERDKRVKIYINEVNLGDYPNRNKAASYASGEYIMYLDSDDKMLIDGLEKCVHAILQFPECCFGMYSPITGTKIHKISSSSAIREHFFVKPFLMIGPGGTIIQKKFFDAIGGYPEKYGPANDLYFNLKACSKTDIVLMPFDFLFYRRHEGQEINNHYNYLYNNYRYFRDALNDLELPISTEEYAWLEKKNKRRFVVGLTRHLWENRDIKKTVQAINKAEFTLTDALSGIFH